MDDMLIVAAIVIAILAVIAGAAWYVTRQRRSRKLRSEFGSEYTRVEATEGSRGADRELQRRRQRVERLNIMPLPREEAESLSIRWRDVQARFVDSPSQAISEADALVTEAMRKRGYPMGDFDQRAADISVDHPGVVSDYRSARAIAVRNATGDASTEELRQAIVHYRALFADLLDEQTDAGALRAMQAEGGRR
jgi:hypothetical protein